MLRDPDKIRNIAIIAHVDHGKTTLLDGLLKQSNTFRDNQAEMAQELIMDSGDQERERGITITAKITAVRYDDYRINIIDTPGHADFSGEVERTLNLADGCLLIVDAQEGPMPQTKFVLSKALAAELKPIVIINKVDKPASRIKEVEDEIADLFLELAVHADQLQYPVYYSVGRSAKAWEAPPTDINEAVGLEPIFKAIIEHVPAPQVEADKAFQMLVAAIGADDYRGKYVIGKISRGLIKPGNLVAVCKRDGAVIREKVDKVYLSQGVTKIEVEVGVAGDIVQLTGINDVNIGDTIADVEQPEALPAMAVEEPTLKIYLGPNTSPFKGQEGEFNTSRQLEQRLNKELETNIGLRVANERIGFLVSGRGELHLSVLIEAMRREGYEFEVGRPEVVTHQEQGITMEPIEEVIIEVSPEYVGAVQLELGMRRAVLKDQFVSSKGVTKLVYTMPSRALLGMRNALMTKTKGTLVLDALSMGYRPMGTPIQQLRNGVLIAFETGIATPYSLQNAEARGTVFIKPGQKVYAGQIIGLNNRQEDIEINICKAKQLTNMRSSSSDGVVQLTPATILSLEESLNFIEADELLEVTPKSLRLRKKELDRNKRKRAYKYAGHENN